MKLRVIPIPRYAMTSMKTEAYDKNGHLIFTLKDGRKFTEVLKELCRINVPIEVISGMDVYAPILEGTASWESLKTRMSEDMNTQGPCAKPALSMQNAIGYSQEPAAKMKPRIFLTVFPVIIVLLMIFCMAVWGQNSGSSPTDEQGQAMEIQWQHKMVPSTLGQKDADSDTVRWFSSTYAIYTEEHNLELGTVGGLRDDDKTHLAEMKDMLKKNWDVSSRASAIDMSNWLLAHGHRMKYREMVSELSENGDLSLSEDDFMKKYAENKNSYRYQAIYQAYHTYGDKALDAWDYVRELKLLGQSYDCGYISLQERLDQSLPVARKMQSEFDSWSELYQSYVYGYRFWNRTGDIEKAMNASYYQDNVDILSMEEKDEVSDHSLTKKYKLGNYHIKLSNTWRGPGTR